MKILGISGSPRKKNTYHMLETVLKASGCDYEIIVLKDKNIEPCRDCRKCHRSFECVAEDDMQEIHKKLIGADRLVLGSPTYFHNVSGPMKNFMDRCLPFYFSRRLQDKKTALVTVGNFEEYLEFDKDGKCKWHKEEQKAVKRCLRSMEYFSQLLGFEVVGSVSVIHSQPQNKEKELMELGQKLKLK